MAITTTLYDEWFSSFVQPSPKTGASMPVLAGDVITVVAAWGDTNPVGTPSISSVAGTALTWTQFVDLSTGSARIVGWWARVTTNENQQVRVAWSSGNNLVLTFYSVVHRGALASGTPVANVFSGTGSAGVSRSITPGGSGSALWLAATNTQNNNATSFTAGANCTVLSNFGYDTHDTALIAPTVNPRTDAATFTLSETHTGNTATVSWVAYEVLAAGAGGGSSPKQALLLGVG